MDTLSVPFLLQVEGEERPDLTGFVDPICVPAKVVSLDRETSSTPESRELLGQRLATAPYPGEFNTSDTGLPDQAHNLERVQQLLDTAGLLRGTIHLLRMPADTLWQVFPT